MYIYIYSRSCSFSSWGGGGEEFVIGARRTKKEFFLQYDINQKVLQQAIAPYHTHAAAQLRKWIRSRPAIWINLENLERKPINLGPFWTFRHKQKTFNRTNIFIHGSFSNQPSHLVSSWSTGLLPARTTNMISPTQAWLPWGWNEVCPIDKITSLGQRCRLSQLTSANWSKLTWRWFYVDFPNSSWFPTILGKDKDPNSS